MTDITIRITTDASGAVTGMQQVTAATGDMGKSADSTGQSFVSMAAGAVSVAEGLIAGATAAAGMIDKVVSLGESVQLTTQGLNAMSGGQSAEYLDKLRDATHGLVPDMELAKDATLALSTGVVSSSSQMAKLAEDGAALGRVFQGDASAGIQTLTRDLETVGNTRGLKQLGIDAQAVKVEFDQLKASGDDIQTAWNTAVMDQADADVAKLGDTFDTAGSSIERFKTQVSNAFDSFASSAATGFEGFVDGINGIIHAFQSGQAQVALGLAKPSSEFGIGNAAGTSVGDDQLRMQKEAQMSNWYETGDQKNTLNQEALMYTGAGAIGNETPGTVPNQFDAITTAPDVDQTMQQKIAAAQAREDTTVYKDLATSYTAASQGEYAMMVAGQAHMATMSQEALYARDVTLAYQDQYQAGDRLKQQAASDLAQSLEGSAPSADHGVGSHVDQMNAYDALQNSAAGAAADFETIRANGIATMNAMSQSAQSARNMAIDAENAAVSAQKEAEARKSMTAAAALGAGSNTLAGSIFSGMDAAEQQREAADKGNPQKLAADQAAYTQVKNAGLIATGQATAASIAEATAQSTLDAAYAKGSITASQYESQLMALYNQIDKGTASTQALTRAQQAADLAAAPQAQKLALAHSQRADQADAATDQATGDPTGTANVNAAIANQKKLQDSASATSNQMDQLKYGRDALDAANNKAIDYSGQLDRMNGKTITTYVKQVYTTVGTPMPGVNNQAAVQ